MFQQLLPVEFCIKFASTSPSSNYTHDNLGKEFKLTDQDNFLCEAEFSVLKS